MNSICKVVTSFIISISLTACQSVDIPKWYSDVQVNDQDYISAVGEGINLEQAKKAALGNINAALWTEVNSSFSMNDTYRNNNDKSYFNEYTSSSVNTKTADIGFSNIDFINVTNNGERFYAQARVKKSDVASQLKSDLITINSKAKSEINKIKHQDILVWWLNQSDMASCENYVSVRKVILGSILPDENVDTSFVDALAKRKSEVKSDVLIYIQSSRKDKKISQMLGDKFSEEGISISWEMIPAVTHVLTLSSNLSQSEMGGAYISTNFTTLQIKNTKQFVIGSSEFISTGNSLSSYKVSKEGSERHFLTQVSERGLWRSLGFKL